ncbi:MAG: hypothetical protein NWF07_07370, partial [Candidatus Bathyarchaeota archaeon]|nr:hypothetical protein [Candidatus Bathyarchaeota archaeon]
TVGLSVWNTAPTMGSNPTVNPSGTIPENTSTLAVSWPAATDSEGGTMTYTLWREYNNSGTWTQLYSGSNLSYNDNIGTGNQGQQIQYKVQAKDSGNLTSNIVYSSTVTKNVFTKATLSSSSSINFNSTSVAFSVSGASNTNGSTTFSYNIESTQITVYNGTGITVSGGAFTLSIYKSGDTPAGPYVNFADIKTYLQSSGYAGTLTFRLRTTNAYGTDGLEYETISTNITISPTSFTVNQPTGTYSIGGSDYFIPNRKSVAVTWSASTDQLDVGGNITYSVLISYNNGSSWSTIATGLTGTSYSGTRPKVSSAITTVKYRVTAYTSYGTNTSATQATAITFHYYDPPTISFNSTNRTQTSATISGSVSINSSITGLTIVTTSPSTYYTTTGGLVISTPTEAGWNGTNNTFSSPIAGLDGSTSFTYILTIQDTAGSVIGTGASVLDLFVQGYVPSMTVRSNGVCVNDLPDGINEFIVGGATNVNTGPLTITDVNSTIGGSNLSNGWLQIGTGLAFDPNEMYFSATTGYIGTLTGGQLNFRNGSTTVFTSDSSGLNTYGDVSIRNGNNLTLRAATGSSDAGDIVFQNGDGVETFRLWMQAGTDYPAFRVNGGSTQEIWTSGNDGTGSGLDADLLDGNHASAFASASHNQSHSTITLADFTSATSPRCVGTIMGTGSPPAATSVPRGTMYLKYV